MLTRWRLILLPVAVVLAAVAVIAPSGAPTANARTVQRDPFTRTVEPWVPGQPPSTPPSVDLNAACVRLVAGGRLEAVFGYDNPGTFSVFAGLEPDTGLVDSNVIIHDTWRVRRPHWTREIEDLGPQATLFLPGSNPHAFAVRFKLNERVAWQVRVPSSDDPVEDPGWKVTVRPRLLAPCEADVPRHFAVVQNAAVFLGPTNIARDEQDHVTSYDAEIAAAFVRVACSAGGQELPFEQVVGWSDGTNLVPLPAGEFDEIVVGNGAVFEMTTIRVRHVVDIFEPVHWLGPIADVTGRCAFGDEVFESEVFWAGQPALGSIEPQVVDGAVVELLLGLVLPGGVRLR